MKAAYTQKDIDALIDARINIGAAVTWEDTEEGYKYWNDVTEKLDRIVANMKKTIVPKIEGKL